MSVSHECVELLEHVKVKIFKKIPFLFKVSMIFLKIHNPGKSMRTILLEENKPKLHNPTYPHDDHRHNIQLVVNNDIVNDYHYRDDDYNNEHAYDYLYGEIRKE